MFKKKRQVIFYKLSKLNGHTIKPAGGDGDLYLRSLIDTSELYYLIHALVTMVPHLLWNTNQTIIPAIRGWLTSKQQLKVLFIYFFWNTQPWTVRKVFLVLYEEVGRGRVSLWLTKVSANASREINSLSRGRRWRFAFDSVSGTASQHFLFWWGSWRFILRF